MTDYEILSLMLSIITIVSVLMIELFKSKKIIAHNLFKSLIELSNPQVVAIIFLIKP